MRTRLSGLVWTTGERWPGLPTGGERLSITLRVVWAIGAGTDEAVRRRHDLLGVEHLLLGFVRESLGTDAGVLERVTGRPGREGAGANVLELIGLDTMALRSTLEEALDQPPK